MVAPARGLSRLRKPTCKNGLHLDHPFASSDSAFTLLSCASSPRLLGNPGRRGVRHPATISNDAVNSLKRSQHSACRVRHLDPGADPTQRLDIEGCAHWSAVGLVSRVTPVHTAMRNCTRDEGRSFEFGNQVLISSHRKLLWSKATVVNVAEKSEQDFDRYD